MTACSQKRKGHVCEACFFLFTCLNNVWLISKPKTVEGKLFEITIGGHKQQISQIPPINWILRNELAMVAWGKNYF